MGKPPIPEKILILRDKEVCGKTEKFSEALLVGANNGIKNVVVSITDIQKGKKWEQGPP